MFKLYQNENIKRSRYVFTTGIKNYSVWQKRRKLILFILISVYISITESYEALNLMMSQYFDEVEYVIKII